MDTASTPPRARRVSQKELAEHLGVTSAALTKARNCGRIWRGDDGLYDLEESVAAFRANRVQPSKPGNASGSLPPPPPRVQPSSGGSSTPRGANGSGTAPSQDFYRYRTLQTKEAWRKARLERRKAQGDLVERAVVDAEWQSLVVRTRDAVMQVPHTMAALLAAESDPRVVRDLLLEALEQALTRLCDDIDQDETEHDIADLEEDEDGDDELEGAA